MTERKGLLPELDLETMVSTIKKINKNTNEHIIRLMNKFEENEDYMLNFILEQKKEGNDQGGGFTIMVYSLLETAYKKQYCEDLPVINSNTASLVEQEIAVKQEEGFFYEMLERLRDDNGLLADCIDRELNSTNDLKSVIP
jgi:hypothetical protein